MNFDASIDSRTLANCASQTNRKSSIVMSRGVKSRGRCNTALQLMGSAGNLLIKIAVPCSCIAGVASGKGLTQSAKSLSVFPPTDLSFRSNWIWIWVMVSMNPSVSVRLTAVVGIEWFNSLQKYWFVQIFQRLHASRRSGSVQSDETEFHLKVEPP